MLAFRSANRTGATAEAAAVMLAAVTAVAALAALPPATGFVVIAALLAALARHEVQGARRSLASAEAAAAAASRDLQITLDHIAEGVVLVDREGAVSAINDKAIAMLELPERFRRPGQPFTEIIEFMSARGEFSVGPRAPSRAQSLLHDEIERVRTLAQGLDHDVYERRRPDGRVLSVASRRMPDGGFVRVISDVTEQRRSAEKIERLHRQDALTSLPNRTAFTERFEQLVAARQGDAGFSLLVIDIDAFKLINEAHGHAVADRLLRSIALRLSQSVRVGDLVARTAGDEFSIVLMNMNDPKIALARARELVKAMREPFVIGEHVLVTTVSIGVALCPANGDSAEELARNAGLALRNAKLEGRNTCRLFASDQAEQITARRQIEHDLSSATLNGQLTLHYQPLVRVRDREVVGFEALLRWQHPTLGMISPAEFIPIAEETGLILPIGRTVLRQACREAARWPGNYRVAVNLSAAQFRTHALVDDIQDALRASGLDPHRLELEVTETALLHNTERTVAQLRDIGAMGVRIAMDDFGTGFSSLNYLREFAFDRIKIDRSFIAELGRGRESDSIVDAIVALARCLGVETTAEGVETPEQFSHLAGIGCDEVQGFLFSRPRPAAEIEQMFGVGRNVGAAPSTATQPLLDLRRDEYRLAE